MMHSVSGQIEPEYAQAWRYLDLRYDDGATQLATTDAIVESVAAGEAPPTLRLYSWSEPVVILGIGQPAGDIDLQACAARGYRVLRRASGGTAVFQDARQLSLEAIVQVGSRPMAPSDVLHAYERFVAPVQQALARLGVSSQRVGVEAARAARSDPTLRAACFGSLSPHELTFDGRKLVGLSQIRRRGLAVLQAAIYLAFDARPLAAAVRASAALPGDAWAERLAGAVADVDGAAGRSVTAAELAAALRAAFQVALGEPLESGTLTPAEQAAVARVVAEKYANDRWTLRR